LNGFVSCLRARNGGWRTAGHVVGYELAFRVDGRNAFAVGLDGATPTCAHPFRAERARRAAIEILHPQS
jgi:hypothetical protein